MIKNTTKFIIIVILSIGCIDKSVIKEFYPNGSIKLKVHVDGKGVKDGLYEQYYDSGELLKKINYSNGKIIDTVFVYHKNGSFKEKGILNNDDLKIGWWSYYSLNGNLKKNIEYFIIRDSLYKNQTMNFNPDGTIDQEKSSYFQLDISDTLTLGKNIGSLQYVSNFTDASDRILDVIIENEYSNSKIKFDTFGENPNKTRFGVFNNKTGKKMIKGSTRETLFYKEKITADSFNLTIKTHKKYFEKEVYVKDTID